MLTSYINIQKRLNKRARIQENAPFAPYNFKFFIFPQRMGTRHQQDTLTDPKEGSYKTYLYPSTTKTSDTSYITMTSITMVQECTSEFNTACSSTTSTPTTKTSRILNLTRMLILYVKKQLDR